MHWEQIYWVQIDTIPTENKPHVRSPSLHLKNDHTSYICIKIHLCMHECKIHLCIHECTAQHVGNKIIPSHVRRPHVDRIGDSIHLTWSPYLTPYTTPTCLDTLPQEILRKKFHHLAHLWPYFALGLKEFCQMVIYSAYAQIRSNMHKSTIHTLRFHHISFSCKKTPKWT